MAKFKTPSEQCKLSGLNSLAELQRLTGEKKESLINWFHTRPKRFEILVEWSVMKKEKINQERLAG